ncbi:MULTISPECIES: hypothetical protein [Halorubrum]|uniref:hypothetical protein n=1 Tax=Halorubrum TaxID=56688 RepID=UPI001267672F|nr:MULTISPECIES: hypothetical protein [Halorubrum]
MVDIVSSIFGIDILSLLFGVAIGLVPTIGFLIVRGTLFEYQEWRKQKQEEKEWYSDVWRTANGIQRSWHYSGVRPEDEDRERTADQMDELTDELNQYKRHENATDEMVEVMNSIIERWDGSRDIILSPHSTQPYHMRGGFISDDAEELKEQVNWERNGRIRKFVYSLPSRIRRSLERLQLWWYERQDRPLPYEIHQAIHPHLTDEQLSDFTNRDVFLRVNREYGAEAVYYDEDEINYNFFQIDSNNDGELVVIDKYPGGTLPDGRLLERLESAESVGTIPYDEIVPDGQSLDEFEYEDST